MLRGLDEFELEPTTLSNLSGIVLPQENIGELSFRVNLKSELLELMQAESSIPLIQENHVGKKYMFCACCNFKIGKVEFDRVVDLPSSDWRELASEWFCHKHSHEGDGHSEGLESLSFRKNDFIVGPTELYFQKDCLIASEEVPNCEIDGKLVCPRCLSFIALVEGSPLNKEDEKSNLSYYCVSKHTAVFHNTDILPPERENIRVSLRQVILGLILKERSPVTSTKFCLEIRKATDETKCLLLWIMNQNLTRYHETRKIAEDGTIELLPQSVVKVLYNVVDCASDKCKLWKKVFECEVEGVSEKTFWDTIGLLERSSQTVPHSQKIVDDFVVGFI